MNVIFVDDSFPFDGLTPRDEPMGGAQKALVYLAEAMAARGHAVTVLNRCSVARDNRGVAWRPIDGGARPDRADLLVALRNPVLLEAVPATRHALWVTTPGQSLLRGDSAQALAQVRDVRLVFMGPAHRATWREDDPLASIIVPGVPEVYRRAEALGGYWPPRAVVTTHPRMDMDWLVSLWTRKIEPLIKGAELHIFSGSLIAGPQGRTVPEEVRDLWRQIEAAAGQGVRVRRPMPDHDMADEFFHARAHLYPGGLGEPYAFTLAESQAVGTPGVTRRQGAAAERIVDGRSGFLTPDDEAFANCAILCLKEDIVYRGRTKDARAMQRGRTWDAAAAEFEALAV
ncbi:MAG: glycosyltransferase [Proteobacteria bacterium]|nr:glycosyltransferase [Pseudomonadota bacterium]